ncbi:cysteine peptidase family C39 domain-containing protein [Tannockella kyphosi]|uniref:cysteine peptidase family C39 domain-containing protein n=1 Tax=Tannockella kyphosi TaxID=2899121 RepID=UPI0020120498|nr:cysteine peptidase family C39 domain-containing protein [Tannockella kyphosi]
MNKGICYQDDITSCGSACVQMILLHFQRRVELKEIKHYCKNNDNGTSVYGMLQCLKHYHLQSKAYHASLDDIQANGKYPCIVLMLHKDLYHYVVLYKLEKGIVFIKDPGEGYIKMTIKEFEKAYQGTVIMIEEVGIPLEKESFHSIYQFYKEHLKDQKINILKISGFTILVTIGNILLSYYFQIYIDTLLETSLFYFLSITCIFVVIYVIKALLHYGHQICLEYIYKENNEKYILRTMQNMLYLKTSDIQKQKVGTLMNKIKGLSSMTKFMSNLYSVLFIDSVILISVFLVLFYQGRGFALFFIVDMFVMMIITYYLMKRIQKSTRKNIVKEDEVNTVFLEGCENLMNIQQFGYRTFFKEKLQHFYTASQYYEVEKNKDYYLLEFVIELVIQGSMYIMMIYCYFLFRQDMISVGKIFFIYMLISYCMEPMVEIVSLFLEWKQQTIIFSRYKDLLPNKQHKTKKIKKIVSLECNYISYSYDYHRTIFSKYDILIDKSIILSGENGCGKTTLCHLLMGFDQVDSGEVLINGINIQEIDQASLYKRMIYLHKNPAFFHETVLFNIIGYRQELRESAIELLQLFQSNDIIEKLDLIMDSDNFSSGQLQLIMLVRAFVINPDVLILDEATSNVDKIKEKLIFDYLETKQENMIIILISHHTKLVNLDFEYVIINKIQKEVGETNGN